MKNLCRILLASASFLTFIVGAGISQAQEVNPLAARESKVPAFVSWMQMQGVKLTFLGQEGGLRGYLAESANGKMQTIYITPDGEHAVGGILFKKGGANLTGVQIGEMRARFDAAANSLGSETLGGEAPAPASESSADEVYQDAPVSPHQEMVDPGEVSRSPLPPVSSSGGVPDVDTSELSLPAADGPVAGAIGDNSELWISKIDKDVFLTAAQDTAYFEVGSVSAPNTIWMVADPQCPYCHKAWDYLRPFVFSKEAKVRVIMIAGLEGSDPIAREFLSSTPPARTWIDTDGGKNFAPSGQTAPEDMAKAGQFLETNMAFAQEFGIDRTPFLGYTADNGQFYSALGLPSDLGSFFSAAGMN